MADTGDQTAPQILAREMGLNAENVERRRAILGFEAADTERIARIRDLVVSSVDQLTSLFFDYVAALGEGKALVSDPSTLRRARQLKRDHLLAMVQGEYGPEYATQRLELAILYGRVGLDLRVFLAGFYHLLKAIGSAVMKRFEADPNEGFQTFMSLQRLAFFDVGIIVDAIVFERERVIRQQQDSIRELSTPVLQIRDRMLLLPIIGVIDTHRARMITESLLRSIRANRAKVVVMDVTGVATIDSRVANHLIQTVTAARLMGATVIVTGLSAEVAQSLVALGIDLEKLNTVGDLQGGVEEAERLLGYRVMKDDPRHVAQGPSTTLGG